jgi:hypothetical protein
VEESVRLRAIVETCEDALERLAREPDPPPVFVDDVRRLRDSARDKLARIGAPASPRR